MPPRKPKTAQKAQDDKVAHKMIQAHKRATSLYGAELKKKKGMSSKGTRGP